MITELPAGLAALESPDVGVVHRVDAGLSSYDHPRLASCYAQSCDTGAIFGVSQNANAGGVATDQRAARLAALGEAVERYSAAHRPPSRLRVAREDELAGEPHAAPDWLDRPAEHGPVRWVPGHLLQPVGRARPAWVAASRAYLTDDDDRGQIAVPTSTGLACHLDPWLALRSALLEVIERDAVMVSWLTEAPVRPIRAELSWRAETGNLTRFDRSVERYQLYLLDSPTGVPVVFATARGSAGQPPIAVGAAADPSIERACRKALLEAQQTFAWAGLMLTRGLRPPASPADLDALDEHVAYYLDPARLPAFDFLDAGGETVEVELSRPSTPPSAERDCRRLIGAVTSAGGRPFAVDVTAPDVRAAGVWVVRAVVPELYPLIVGCTRAPDHPRVPPGTALLRDPHPFP